MHRPGFKLIALSVALATALFSSALAAYDQQVSSNLWAEGYTVYTPGGGTISRRRFVEDLHLAAWHLVPGSADPYYRGPRLSIDLAMRLNTDFGIGKKESRPSQILHYVPGLTPVDVEMLVANLNIQGLWRDTLDLRLGRQIRIDTLGFTAFDGVEARFRLPLGIDVDTYVGYEVRGGHTLGFDALELDGTDTGGRHEMEADRYPDRTDPKPRLVIGAEVSFHPWSWLDAAIDYRAFDLLDTVSDERIGGRLGVGTDSIRIDARAVGSTLLMALSEVDAEFAFTPFSAVGFFIDYHLYRPVFEADSIFNVFDLAAQNDLGSRVELRLTEQLSTAVWAFVRLSDNSAGIDGNASDALLSGAGGGIGGRYKTGTRELSARVSILQEWGERRIGGEIGMGRGFFRSQRLWLRFRGSVWHIDDAFSELLAGNLAGYVFSARLRISEGAHLLGEFEHYVGSERDQRFVALMLLQLDLWR
ncbi:MAG: hypothetical protein QNJ97_14630 [Myxococcota bacterium]|nr:hypothetical protein [Myxococcota bacterium]